MIVNLHLYDSCAWRKNQKQASWAVTCATWWRLSDKQGERRRSSGEETQAQNKVCVEGRLQDLFARKKNFMCLRKRIFLIIYKSNGGLGFGRMAFGQLCLIIRKKSALSTWSRMVPPVCEVASSTPQSLQTRSEGGSCFTPAIPLILSPSPSSTPLPFQNKETHTI